MSKKPLFDVSRFNHLADEYNIPWIDRVPLIETVCWGSKGWIDSGLESRTKGVYKRFMKALERERKLPTPMYAGAWWESSASRNCK